MCITWIIAGISSCLLWAHRILSHWLINWYCIGYMPEKRQALSLHMVCACCKLHCCMECRRCMSSFCWLNVVWILLGLRFLLSLWFSQCGLPWIIREELRSLLHGCVLWVSWTSFKFLKPLTRYSEACGAVYCTLQLCYSHCGRKFTLRFFVISPCSIVLVLKVGAQNLHKVSRDRRFFYCSVDDNTL